MKSVARVNYIGSAGFVQSVSQGSWDFIYRTSTVKDSKWNIGDRAILPDGREFRYAKSATELNCSEGCYFSNTGVIAYTSAVTAAAVGDKEVVVPAATHDELEKDELIGGYINIFGSAADGEYQQFRGIVGNSASAENAAVTIYMDGELNLAVSTSSAYEVWASPYSAVNWDSGSYLPKAGVPAAYVSATGYYVWIQVRGPIFVNPQAGVLTGANGRQGGVFWRSDGSLQDANTALATTIAEYCTSQYAGHVMCGDKDGNGPLFNLQG